MPRPQSRGGRANGGTGSALEMIAQLQGVYQGLYATFEVLGNGAQGGAMMLLRRLYHTPAVVNEFRVLSHRQIPEPWPKAVQTRWTEVHRGAASGPPSADSRTTLTLLWRSVDAALEQLIQERSDLNWQGVRSVLLRGLPGSGKSTSLFHCVERAREHNWLVFYLPKLYHWLHERQTCDFALTPRSKGARGAGAVREPLFFDQARVVLDSLQACRQAHASALESLECASTEQLQRDSDLDDEPGGSDASKGVNVSRDQHPNLLGLIDASLQAGRRLQGDLAEVNLEHFSRNFRLFLRQLQCVREVPVLIAIDDWNLLNALTSIRHPQKRGRFLHASALRSLRPLNAWNLFTRLSARMQRGVVVCAETSARGRVDVRPTRIVGSVMHQPTAAMQRDPDGRDALRWVTKELPTHLQPTQLRIPLFSRDEMRLLLRDLQERQVLHTIDEHSMWRLEALASGNAARLLRICQAV
ncbi:hypothetical protein F1559_003239 [Cyanidiococcus yangmingshanensis]|uniref:Small ribosomal subunit protein mS29 n=1 Tax=Cyanidiococcus yangmingshanensis TaxID=2690220 RepID=A0A7J7IDE4_9RHOD|nr:hypothetical protein F1559_003239 [Cyanidiococcus yangmingshanensis]